MCTMNIYQKIWELRKELPAMKKDMPGYNYKYFDINQMIAVLMPLLEKHNLGILQPLVNVNGRPAIETIVFNILESKEMGSSLFPLPDVSDPQDIGSAITYCRRYSLVSLFFMEAEDNDGTTKKKEASRKQDFNDNPF